MWPVLILQLRSADHVLLTTTCVFPWRQSNKDWLLNPLKDIFNASICVKMKILEIYWHGNYFFIHVLDEKITQRGILSTGWHLISVKNLYFYISLEFLKQCWKCTKVHKIMSNSKFFQFMDICIFQIYITNVFHCLFAVLPFGSLYILTTFYQVYRCNLATQALLWHHSGC